MRRTVASRRSPARPTRPWPSNDRLTDAEPAGDMAPRGLDSPPGLLLGRFFWPEGSVALGVEHPDARDTEMPLYTQIDIHLWCSSTGAWYQCTSGGDADRPKPNRALETMAKAHKLDCEAAEDDCRFIIQSENEQEAIELTRKHMNEVHGTEYSDDELRGEVLRIV